MAEIDKYLKLMEKFGASDLHIKVGAPPIYRIAGVPRKTEQPPLSIESVNKILEEILNENQKEELKKRGNVDFAYSLKGTGRFRINIFRQRGTLSGAIRKVNTSIPSIEELNLPEVVKKIATFKEGLVLVSGTTGSGKSTTLAALLDLINSSRKCHIVTIEDPIEYLFKDKQAFINQREIGIDVPSFHEALRSVIRQDPDIILIGELRDSETFEVALNAAETGHLVFGTLHSATTSQTIGRILDLFPSERHSQIRNLLSYTLKAIICQKLIKGKKDRLVPAVEIMFTNPSIQKIILKGEDKKLQTIITASKEEGMQDFNQSLYDLVKKGLISEQEALKNSPNPEALKMNFRGIFFSQEGIIS